jgi:hypothetical protein
MIASWSGLPDPDRARWLGLLNTEIDLALSGAPRPIPLGWLEERCAEAYAERQDRARRDLDRRRARDADSHVAG